MTRTILLLLILFTSVGISAQQQRRTPKPSKPKTSAQSVTQQTATPRPGDGISAFLKRHGREGDSYYRQFLELNKAKLRGKKELQLGVHYLLPPLTSEGGRERPAPASSPVRSTVRIEHPVGSTIREPLFGKALSTVKVTGKRLQGACFYIVSGHGGPDPGAIGRVGNVELHEDEYAYDVALRLARNLMQEGAHVHIIIRDAKDGIRNERYLNNSKRETCMDDPIPLNQTARLRQRATAINTLYRKDKAKYNYCRAIFLHVDSRSRREQTDVFFYHTPQKEASRRLALTMKNTFQSKYGHHQPNRGFTGTVEGRNLFVLRHTLPTSVFVELGNIQNSFDQRRFVINDNRQALAKWLMEGFITDFKKR
ncbi:MAG: N-acetylmuramoyl-L-alanine amidase [Prevotellaceae bacterium]|nr:N-acetylmuramoyl-L-alanine amidase [Prevotellaceae bacterium]